MKNAWEVQLAHCLGDDKHYVELLRHQRPLREVSSHLAERATGFLALHQKVVKNLVFEVLKMWRSAPKISGHILLPKPPL